MTAIKTKTLTSLLFLIFNVLTSNLDLYAQTTWQVNGNNIYYNTGNVGIGTNNPQQKLDVRGSVSFTQDLTFINKVLAPHAGNTIHFTSYETNYSGPKIYSDLLCAGCSGTTTSDLVLSSYHNGYANELRLHEGKVGIGVSSPAWQLTVKDIITLNGSSSQKLHIRPNSGYAGYIYWAENGVAERGILGFNAGSGDLVYRSGATNFTNGTERFRITSTGRVGIGTSTPAAHLTVNGKILAKEVEVVSSITSDYVFEPEYQLMPLTDLELYLKQNKHLPGIPSAEEFAKTGQNLAKTDDMLLRKIEELTLYTIEQDKKLKQQNEKIQKLEARIEKIEAALKYMPNVMDY